MIKRLMMSIVFMCALTSFVMAQSAQIESVKAAKLVNFQSKSIEQTMKQYSWFSAIKWDQIVMEDGKTAVVCWNLADVNSVSNSSKVIRLAIGFRFVFKNPQEFIFDRLFIMYETQNSRDLISMNHDQKIMEMYNDVYTGNKRFIRATVDAIDKHCK